MNAVRDSFDDVDVMFGMDELVEDEDVFEFF